MTTDNQKLPFIRQDGTYELVDASRFEALPNVHELLDSYRFLQNAYELQRNNIERLEASVDNELKTLQAENEQLFNDAFKAQTYNKILMQDLYMQKNYTTMSCIVALIAIVFNIAWGLL